MAGNIVSMKEDGHSKTTLSKGKQPKQQTNSPFSQHGYDYLHEAQNRIANGFDPMQIIADLFAQFNSEIETISFEASQLKDLKNASEDEKHFLLQENSSLKKSINALKVSHAKALEKKDQQV